MNSAGGDEKKSDKMKGEKGTAREHVEEAKTGEKDDEEDDDVVVIGEWEGGRERDTLSTASDRSPAVPHKALYPSLPSDSISASQMDPPPQYGHPQPQQQQQQSPWFSPASFLGSSPNSPPSAVNGTDQSVPSASASAQRLLTELRQRYQPWSVFFKCAKFGFPPGVAAIGPRVKRNLATFTTNYLCLFALLLLYCVLTSLLMLLSLIVLGGLLYSVYQFTQKGPVIVGAYEVPPSLLYSVALMLSIPLFWLADAGSVMYWVLGFGLFLMLSHSTFYASEEVPGSEFEVVTAA
ncbi:hypothetical protein niasHT_007853 [Heterodera trifolii]|uniref:PRA1 family protein n=1 Tax=Heterodera trifolii TaxID=157864 RepID=A0ABD2LZ94_9BILA